MKRGIVQFAEARVTLFLSSREGWVLAILLGLAFAVRLYIVFHTYLITNDGILYIKMSRLISQGQVETAFRLLFFNLYPLMIVAFQKVFADWEISAQMVSAVFGSLTVIPFHFLIKSLFNRTVATISSILFVFHPYLVRFSAEVIRGPTFWFFLMMTLWVGWEAISRKRAWLFALTSFLGAVSFLLRPEGIFVVALVAAWVLLKDWGKFRSTYRQRIFFVLILLLAAPILVSPAMLYLRENTGRWHLARAEEIPGLAFSDITMESIKRNFDKVEVKPWGDSPEEQLERIRLEIFLSLARDHRLTIIGIEAISTFLKAIHPLLFVLLAFGAIKRKSIEYHKSEELFLLSVLAVFLLVLVRYGTVFIYIGTRHMMVPVILCLAWAGAGVVEVEHRIRNTLIIKKSTGKRIFNFRHLRLILLILVVFGLLPKALASQRLEKMPIREAGMWIKENGPKNPVVMVQRGLERVAFYADGIVLGIPQNHDLSEYARRQEADFLAINENNIEKTRPGLIRSLGSEQFKKQVAFGKPSGPYVIGIYSVID